MAATALLLPIQQFFDDDGDPLSGGLLFSYIAGTSTPSPLYADSTLLVPNENPVELDSAGRAVLYVDPAVSLKLVLKDADENTLWTQDLVSPAAVAS